MELNETLAYGALGAGGVFLLFATQFAPIALLSIVCALLAYMFYRWGNIYVPFLVFQKKEIQVPYIFEVSPAEDAVFKQVGDDYVATVFLNLDVYETMTNKNSEEVNDYAHYFERSISSVKDPIKISTILYERDMGRYAKAIEEKKAALEDKIAAERQKKKADPRIIEVLEREKLMWERRLEGLYKSTERPRAVEYIVATSAFGPSRDAALSAAKTRAREIKATFAGGMSVNVDELTRNRMRSCFEWEFLSPEW